MPSSPMTAYNPSTRQEFQPTDPGTQVILHNPDRCTGCRQCMTACSFKNFLTYNYDLSLCRVITGPKGEFIRVHCHHCADPMCMAACPTQAIHKDPVTGVVSVDKIQCIGCKACTWACPLSIPQMQRGLKAMTKCDLCGGDPSCIKVCSAKAIQLVTRCDSRQYCGSDIHE
ncbi:MAG: 4Fe-4S dicluster domain-containing protein [Methanospirillum sp.]|uniref:4Fe-4S dicluster domain-containing protein n=1 Tax=Methanospirillum sp. TaxID=45200 RepID=UPI00236D89CC|nr:4Fe-4S dicluster domain-containing protein [Methanospirillum sp.]MDD1727505.1 4Fe-4S dicluster domain-containing protein [Methanospirillum sp.]